MLCQSITGCSRGYSTRQPFSQLLVDGPGPRTSRRWGGRWRIGLLVGRGLCLNLRDRGRCGLCLAAERKSYSKSNSNIMVGLLHNLGNHIIFEIDSECDIVRQPVFRSYTNIKSSHVLRRYRWTIVGSSETGKDKGVEFTIGHKVIDDIEMIKSKVHVYPWDF